MPKNNDLNLIAQAVLQSPVNPEKSTHYFFLLGTDTEYTYKSTKDYPRAETFSYLANVVASKLNEAPIIQNDVLAFNTESIDLLNGPTTLGTEVGYRIAQGLFLVLKAIAEGKKTIKILAHSRGAVQAMLITHELERIKQELHENKDASIFQIIARTPCPYTRAAVNELFKDIGESREIRNQLYNRLIQKDFKLELFLIDPVPGGSWLGLGKVLNLAWRNEPRFYQKLPCSKAMLFICMHETTRCFIPIVPEGTEIIPIPGHHGTASGNPNDQQGQPVPEIHHGDTGLVQQLTLFKALEFLEGDTNFISSGQVIDLKFKGLDEITNAFITTERSARSQILFDLYDAIQKNIQAYQYFKNTSYQVLGSEVATSGARYIHAGGHNYIPLDTLIPDISTHFVNKEHATLYLLTKMGFDFSVSALEPDRLKQKIKELASFICENLALCQYSSSSSSSNQSRKSLQLIASSENRTIVFEAMSIFLDQMGQIYLRNHISHDDKIELLTLIKGIFEQIKNIDDQNIRPLRDEYLKILKTSLKKTVETQSLSLIDQSVGYSRRFEHYQQPNALQLLITKKVPSLAEKFKEIESLEDLNVLLNEIQDQEEKNALQERLVNTREIKDYLDICNSHPEEIILELEKLYENLDHLINAVPTLESLTELPLNIKADLLSLYKDQIIKLAASLVTRDRSLLNRIQVPFSKGVEGQAIALGLESEEIIILKESMKRSDQNTQETLKMIKEFVDLNQSLVKKYQDLENQYNDLVKEHQSVTKSNEDLMAQNTVFEAQNIEFEAKNKASEARNKTLEDRNIELEDQKAALNSPEESICLNQIHLKLMPLTRKYRDHLWEEACKINPDLGSEGLLPTQLPVLATENPSYQALVTKYAIANNLLIHLRDVDINPLPSKRLEAFAAELEQADKDLSVHRDPTWSRYLKNSMIALLIIGTGILPGLLVLSIYASCNNRSLFFFNQSRGNEFVEQAADLISNAAPIRLD